MHYTILLLCWPAGKESKIHNHPCDGCFVKSVRGQIKETKYVEEDKCDASTIEGNASSRCMRVISEVVLSPGEVTYMDDFIGYHKVGNAETDETQDCAITLHVYTPPYQSCKVWASPENADEFFTGTVCHYSEYGQIVCTQSKMACSKAKEGWQHYYI